MVDRNALLGADQRGQVDGESKRVVEFKGVLAREFVTGADAFVQQADALVEGAEEPLFLLADDLGDEGALLP